MFDIQKYITETLSDLDCPVSFVARGETRLPMVVFNYSEFPVEYWDDVEKVTKYQISINLFSRDNYIKLKNQILEKMTKAGFRKSEIPVAIYMEDTSVYNQPMFFDYYNIEIIKETENE